MNNEQLTPRITPTLITSYPDQLAHILNRFIEDFYEGDWGSKSKGNLDSIEQTTTSYDDGGVNIITAYLSDGTTSEFQIRNGKKGSQGDPGPAGQDGAPGADGFSPIATVTKSGDTATISITDAGGTTTATVSDGADGAPGADGQAATIAVGSTSTLTPGSSATVTNSGTSSAAVFDFGIPKGEKGDTGATGPANSLSIGTVTSGSTASATITGTPPNQTLSLVLPKGDPGQDANVVNAYSTSTTDAYSANYVNGVIPTVNDATLTIQKNGTTVNTFTANASSNVTANITVPTKTSDITNDSNYVSDASYVHTDNNFTTTLKDKLDGIEAGAEVNVQADWDQSTSTADDYIKNKPTIPSILNAQSSSTTDAYSAGYVEDNFQAKDSVYTFTITLSGTSQNWTDTGITNADLPTGTYAMQIETTSGKIGQWNPVYSATIAWQNRVSNDSRTNEILLMHMGHADNGAAPGQRLFLRILQQTGSKAQKLQYAYRIYYNDTTTATFTFRRLI